MDLFSDDLFSSCRKPLSGVRLYAVGNFRNVTQKEARRFLSDNGAEIANEASKYIHAAFVGSDVDDDALSKIDKLRFNGFHIPTYGSSELDDMMNGRFNLTFSKVVKSLELDVEHYDRLHIDMSAKRNPIYGKEIYFGCGFSGHFQLIDQMTGFLGSSGDRIQIYPDTNMIALSDSSVNALRNGIKDDAIRYIEDTYNRSDAVVFDYKFVGESDILSLCQKWADEYGSVEMARYLNMYRNSSRCGRFVAIDFETIGGVDIDGKIYHHLPVSVGMVKVDKCEVVGRYQSLMRPPLPDEVDYCCYVDRSLNQDTLRDAPSYDKVISDMLEFCGDADYLVCHNYTENYVLTDLSELCGLSLCKPMRDTLRMLKQHGETDNSLTSACQRYGVRHGEAHDALSDAMACAGLYVRMLEAGVCEDAARMNPDSEKKSNIRSVKHDISAYSEPIDESMRIPSKYFNGISVCITGNEYRNSDELYAFMHQRGAVAKSSVSSVLDWLVLGPDGQKSVGKIRKAKDLGVRIMQLDELLRLIEEETLLMDN